MPASLHGQPEAEVRHDRDHHGVVRAGAPRAAQVEGADGDDVVAVDDGPGVVDGDQPVGVAVEGQAQRRPLRAARPAWRSPGCVRAAVVVDVACRRARRGCTVDVGAEPLERERGQAVRGAVGAVEHHRGARRGGDRRGRRRGARRSLGTSCDRPSDPPTPAPDGPAGRLAEDRARSSASMRSSTSSGSLRPPGANSLMPLSAKGLCEAEIIAPAHRLGRGRRRPPPASGTTPRSSTSTPSAAKPAASAASSRGPEMRVSRPTTTRSPPSTRAAARPRARVSSGVSSVLATPRTPSVPNCERHGRRARQRLEYCGALRAFLRPYFLLSFSRASRVRRPAFFSVGRSSGSSSTRARAMARRSAPA